jgi:DNA polymerase V
MPIPLSLATQVLTYIDGSGYKLPLYSSGVSAGTPLPGDDHVEAMIDLNQYLLPDPNDYFLVRALGDSMKGAGISHGDLLVVCRAIAARHDHIVIASVEGHLTVKRLYKKNKSTMLMPENPEFKPIDVSDADDIYIWGVVTVILHPLMRW